MTGDALLHKLKSRGLSAKFRFVVHFCSVTGDGRVAVNQGTTSFVAHPLTGAEERIILILKLFFLFFVLSSFGCLPGYFSPPSQALFDLLGLDWFVPGGLNEVEGRQETEAQKHVHKDVVCVKNGEKYKVPHLYAEKMVYVAETCVAGKGRRGEFDDRKSTQKDENQIEQEGVHVGPIYLHRV